MLYHYPRKRLYRHSLIRFFFVQKNRMLQRTLERPKFFFWRNAHSLVGGMGKRNETFTNILRKVRCHVTFSAWGYYFCQQHRNWYERVETAFGEQVERSKSGTRVNEIFVLFTCFFVFFSTFDSSLHRHVYKSFEMMCRGYSSRTKCKHLSPKLRTRTNCMFQRTLHTILELFER